MAQVYLTSDDDAEMQAAVEKARSTFRYFWREQSWEYRRIVPGLDMACVKAAFQDPPESAKRKGADGVEHMWLAEIRCNGKDVTGRLLNSPNWLTSISEGDEAVIPLKGISDWMYVIQGRAYGGYTINLLRSRMSKRERAEHDGAWGLDFGDPNEIKVIPDDWSGEKPKGFIGRLFGGRPKPVDPDQEHPMAVNMGDSLKTFLKTDPQNASSADDEGFTMLHQLVMAGTTVGVKTLLEHGADPNVKTNNGMSALGLARALGWRSVFDLLKQHGAK